jgi:SSS family solute:Na+ symporter
MRVAVLSFLFLSFPVFAGDYPRLLYAFTGKTPQIDGIIDEAEWDDATQFYGTRDWIAQFSPTSDEKDLALHGWVKHDAKRLYFAFVITDDVLYGIDTPRWLPENNPNAHELTPQGYPWFGDEIEILINASNRWSGNENAAGTGSSWQMVCNATKSRKGGVGNGGLLEGEPRSNPQAWSTYQRWIEAGSQECAVRPRSQGKGYIMEWAISFDPCLEIEPGKFYTPALGNRPMGLNIAIGDLDEKERGDGNFANFHHEDWWAGLKDVRTQLRHWGTLWIMTETKLPPPSQAKPKLVPEPSRKKKPTKRSRR